MDSLDVKLGKYYMDHEHVSFRVVAVKFDDPHTFYIDNIQSDPIRITSKPIGSIFEIPKKVDRFAAVGVQDGKIIIGDTKDSECYAENSFAKHFPDAEWYETINILMEQN